MKELIKILDEIWKFYENDKQGLIDFFASGYKHFDKKAKKKEAKKMEVELELKRQCIEKIKEMIQKRVV